MGYNPYSLTPEGMKRAADPSERVAAQRAVFLLEQSLTRIGRPAVVFLPIHQPERERGEPVWRLTAMGGRLQYGVIVAESVLADPATLDVFTRDHTTDEKGARIMGL